MARRSAVSVFRRSVRTALTVFTHAARRVDKDLRSSAARLGVAGALRAGALRAPRAKAVPVGMIGGAAIGLRYWLFRPPGVHTGERLPLMVMLHGCSQDAMALMASSRMNRIAVRQRFLVLYPEQNALVNPQRCWHWYDTRSGLAQREAHAIGAAIDQVCRRQPVDPKRIVVAGLSAGAGMAAILAMRYPGRFAALAMHSGVAPGTADSLVTALRAMRGASPQASPLPEVQPLPPLLIIHGDQDPVVHSSNAAEAARWWAEHAGARAVAARRLVRGNRYPVTRTDYRLRGGIVASLCEVHGLGHAWSGGASAQPFSDVRGPDASRMIWTFAARQFAEPG